MKHLVFEIFRRQLSITHTGNIGEDRQRFLLESAVALDRKLTGKSISHLSFLQKLLQLFLNLFGFFLGFVFLKAPPSKISNRVTGFLARRYAKNRLAPILMDTRFCSSVLADGKGKGLGNKGISKLILISHPETVGSKSYLLGNLIFYAVKINRELLGNPKFQFLQAIDPFALDTLPTYLEAIYAGFMSAGHIAMDRQPYLRNFFQRALFSRSHYTNTIFHILRELKSGRTVCAALSGGVIHNAKIFYLLREFALGLYRAAVISNPSGRPLKSFFEKQIISILSEDEQSAIVTGKLSEKERKKLELLCEQWGVSQEWLKKLEQELSLPVPYRLRLFRILFKRLAAQGYPLLLLPLTHTQDEKIILGQPVWIRSVAGDALSDGGSRFSSDYENGEVKWKNLVKGMGKAGLSA